MVAIFEIIFYSILVIGRAAALGSHAPMLQRPKSDAF